MMPFTAFKQHVNLSQKMNVRFTFEIGALFERMFTSWQLIRKNLWIRFWMLVVKPKLVYLLPITSPSYGYMWNTCSWMLLFVIWWSKNLTWTGVSLHLRLSDSTNVAPNTPTSLQGWFFRSQSPAFSRNHTLGARVRLTEQSAPPSPE